MQKNTLTVSNIHCIHLMSSHDRTCNDTISTSTQSKCNLIKECQHRYCHDADSRSHHIERARILNILSVHLRQLRYRCRHRRYRRSLSSDLTIPAFTSTAPIAIIIKYSASCSTRASITTTSSSVYFKNIFYTVNILHIIPIFSISTV